MRRILTSIALSSSVLVVCAGAAATSHASDREPTITNGLAASATRYPLHASANRRYLVDRRGRPFLMVGDSPQALVVNLSLPEIEHFLADRSARGFNAVWVNLLCAQGNGGRPGGATRQGVAPFRRPGDLATPNDAYFRRVDAVVRIAARYGIVVLLDPIETIAWLDTLLRNGPQKAFAYGEYVGRRYRQYPNIVWFNGNDFQSWRRTGTTAVVKAVARGIKAVDPSHIQTIELNYFASGSLDDPRWRSLIGLDAAYTYFPTYAQVLKEYNRSGHLPTFMVEANYEFEHDYSGPQTLRRQEYWTLLSGATGQLYGNKYTWQFVSGWKEHLDTVGVTQLGYVTKLFSSQRWYDLVPDQHHVLVTDGYGTFSASGVVDDNDYVTAARTRDGTLAIAYLPVLRPVTVDLRQMSGRVLARWYDPTTGRFSPAADSPLPNRGSETFVPAGTNNDGDQDWVLVLKTI